MPDESPARPPCLQQSLLTARLLIEWQRAQGRRIDPVPTGILVTHQAGLFRSLTPRFGRGRARHRLLAQVSASSQATGIAGGFGVGAAATAMAIEELAALGARSVIAVDVAAALSERLEGPAVLVATKAYCGDGVSHHYGAQTFAGADPGLAAVVVAALTGTGLSPIEGMVASTDAPYRETASEVQRYQDLGALAVDMETAALFAVSAALGVNAAAVLIAADSLQREWAPPPDPRLVQSRLRAVARVALRCLTV